MRVWIVGKDTGMYFYKHGEIYTVQTTKEGRIPLNNAFIMEADKSNVIPFGKSDTLIIKNKASERLVWLPTRKVMENIMGEGYFAVTLTVIAHKDNDKNFCLAFQDGDTSIGWRDYNGKPWNQTVTYNDERGTTKTNKYARVMGVGDVFRFVLIYDDSNYWAQLLEYHDS